MHLTTGLLMLSVTSLGCSGKYEVGEMDVAAGGSRSASRTAAGGAASGSSAVGYAGPATEGGTSSGVEGPLVGYAGAATEGGASSVGEFGLLCVPSPGVPAPLLGPFAKPAVVWSRLAMLIWGIPAPPPTGLPTTTTYAWASQVVAQGFANVDATLGGSPGAKLFVSRWLELGLGVRESTPFKGHYSTLLPKAVPALEVLLLTPLGETGRTGVFTEPIWLALHKSISSRGRAMLANVMHQEIPPAPPGSVLNPMLDTSVSDRAALQEAVLQPQCNACHNLLDQPGYALGNFDSDGGYRTLDHGAPVDTTGKLQFGDVQPMFDGIADFGVQLADKCQPNLALAHGFLGIALDLAGFSQDQQQALLDANIDRVQQAFVRGSRSYPALVTAFAQSEAVLRP